MTLVIRIPTAVEEMIFQCCKSFLFCEGHPWVKIGTENFDTAMGSYMGVELCEMVGLYILYKLTSGKEPLFEKSNVGLYRDDGFALIKLNKSGRTAERLIKPKLNAIFSGEGLRITVDPALQVIDYLDVKLNLHNHTHSPYRKPNNHPIYINVKSNHPDHILKQVPKNMEKRLSYISSNEKIFEQHKQEYQIALNQGGHKYELNYQKPQIAKKRNRSRKVVCFNPPFSKSV